LANRLGNLFRFDTFGKPNVFRRRLDNPDGELAAGTPLHQTLFDGKGIDLVIVQDRGDSAETVILKPSHLLDLVLKFLRSLDHLLYFTNLPSQGILPWSLMPPVRYLDGVDDGHIGVDESGKGDFFGPLVIAACYVGPEHLAELEGVKDSKKLTDPIALRLADKIKRACPHSVIAIGPGKYNELYAKFNNLNSLLAWGHARAIENVLEQTPATRVISDEFAKGGFAVKRALYEKGRALEFISAVRAEQDIAVAAASILARAEFLRRLKRLGEEFGTTLPKGASNVIDTGVRFVKAHGAERLGEVAKLHFKTSAQVLEKARG